MLLVRAGGWPGVLVDRGGASGRARHARTAVAQEAEWVVARLVAVRPVGRDRVVADQVQVRQACLVWTERGGAVEPAGHAGLAAAVGARAQPAQRDRVERADVPVRPGQAERARLAIGVDRGGGGAGG